MDVANRGAVDCQFASADPDLQMVIDHWDDLPEDVRSSILLIVRAGCGWGQGVAETLCVNFARLDTADRISTRSTLAFIDQQGDEFAPLGKRGVRLDCFVQVAAERISCRPHRRQERPPQSARDVLRSAAAAAVSPRSSTSRCPHWPPSCSMTRK